MGSAARRGRGRYCVPVCAEQESVTSGGSVRRWPELVGQSGGVGGPYQRAVAGEIAELAFGDGEAVLQRGSVGAPAGDSGVDVEDQQVWQVRPLGQVVGQLAPTVYDGKCRPGG